MGVFKIIRHTDGGYDYFNHAVNYVIHGHTDFGNAGSPNVNLECAVEQMHYVKKYFDKRGGNPIFHFIVVYNTKTAYDIGRAKSITRHIADYFADRYQIVWGVHEKRMSKRYGGVSSMYHAHFVMNSVSYIDGKMFRGDYSEIYAFLEHIKRMTNDKSWTLRYGSDKENVCEVNQNDI